MDDSEEIKIIIEDLDLILQGIEENIVDFIVLYNEMEVTGCVGLEIYNDVALLRSLAVKYSYQKQGYGAKLLKAIEEHARTKNVKSLFLLTNTAESFFVKYDYVVVDRNEAPLLIKQTKEFSELCPDSSIFMKKEIRKE